MTEYGLVLVTVASEEEGKAIAATLLKEKLAACITLIPVQSMYVWQGETHCDPEFQLIIKTRLDLFPQLSEKIKQLHSYDLPEMIVLPIIKGDQGYLDWISESVSL